MLFTTPTFLFLFLPIFLLAYYALPDRGHLRNYVALLGSIVFFAWAEPLYVFFLIASIYFDYWLSNRISVSSTLSDAVKKRLLTFGILLNVIVLIVFKYTTFVIADILIPLHLYSGERPETNLPLLVGISFITFHKISFLVDSYKGRAVPPRNLFDCALYIFLFPQLIAGPIIRYHDIGAQIHSRSHTSEAFLVGVLRFGVGLGKKVLIADPLGALADRIFGLPTSELTPVYAWLGAFAYMLQIYFDFSGYSDMAIGLGRMIGFRFPENFNRPYISRSITEFWRRWHISLSSWMRIYLYIPLGGSRVSQLRSLMNLWIVFVVSGLWHGANWTFLLWGAYYGFFLCIEKYASNAYPSFKNLLPSPVKLLVTMIIVLFGWVIFRSPNIGHALDFMNIMVGGGATPEIIKPWGLMIGRHELFLLCVGSIFSFVTLSGSLLQAPAWLSSAWSEHMTVQGRPTQVTAIFITTLTLIGLSVMALLSSDYTPFLYFRF